MLCRDELIGALTLDHEGGRTFSAQDQAVLRLFADEAAIVIKNARRYTAPQQALTDLRQTQEELIRAEKLRGLGQMAAGIAHDFNNTLATILGQTELLRLRFRAAPQDAAAAEPRPTPALGRFRCILLVGEDATVRRTMVNLRADTCRWREKLILGSRPCEEAMTTMNPAARWRIW